MTEKLEMIFELIGLEDVKIISNAADFGIERRLIDQGRHLQRMSCQI